MIKTRKIITILLTVLLSLSCFSAFACNRGEEKTYSITYDVAGGTLPADAVSTYSISEQDIPLPVPTKAGHTFTGWQNGNEIITVIAAGTKSDLYLTATWQANSYTITFDYGEGSGTETSRSVEYGSQINNLPQATAPAGKIFAGWKIENGEIFADNTAYNFETGITLTAIYSTEQYVINYNVAGGDPLPADAVSAYSISEQNITLPTPTKTGYTFTGWNNGTEVVTVIAAGTTGNLNLTAVWQAKSYTITFDYGEGSGTETSRNVEYGSQINNLPQATAPSEDKVFVGWKKPDNSIFNNGDRYLFDGNVTLTALFDDITFTVTINNATSQSFTDWADGSQDSKIIYVDYGDKLTIPKIKWDDFDEAQKSGNYSFKGWFYKDKDNVTRQFDPDVELTLSNLNVNTYNFTIYAKVQRLYGPIV